MTRSFVSFFAASSLLAATAVAQSTLTDAAGGAVPLVAGPYYSHYQFESEEVFLAFDAAIPDGDYYIHVTDPYKWFATPDTVTVLSTNDPLERLIRVARDAGGHIVLSYALASGSPTTGVAANGDQTLRISNFLTDRDDLCEFKIWIGDSFDIDPLTGLPFDPTNPWLLYSGTGTYRENIYFNIGDGLGTDISGYVFEDLDRSGARGPGEPGIAGVTVQVVDAGSFSQTTVTDATGRFEFLNVPWSGEPLSYTVEMVVPSGYLAVGPSSRSTDVCSCAPVFTDFGLELDTSPVNHDGHTPGFWRNKHGLELITQYGVLSMLPSLNIVDRSGSYFVPQSLQEYRAWMKHTRADNMANKLSAHLVAMFCNVTVGFVNPDAVIDDPVFGQVTIGSVMILATASLATDPFTPAGHPERAYQEALKNALDAANNNQNWL